jgi:hypothetical protein
MSHEGFDRLLASHSDLFKRIGKYGANGFCRSLSEELLQKQEFAFVRANTSVA